MLFVQRSGCLSGVRLWRRVAACCWKRLNQRMHSKMLLVDRMAGITGGRNYQNDYYDWDDSFNFRERQVQFGARFHF